jgi:dGTPase
VDDGLRSGLITLNQLEEVSIFSRHLAPIKNKHPWLPERRMVYETIRSMINTLVTDLIQHSTINIKNADVNSLAEVHAAPPLIGFSQQIKKEQQELKKFLYDNLYRHFRVVRMSNKARHTIERLFTAFSSEIRLLPAEYQKKFDREGYKVIADYIAGMTDRYAIKEYQRLFTIAEN